MSNSSMSDVTGETEPILDENTVTHIRTHDALAQTNQHVDSKGDCKSAQYIRDLYTSGARLWTKDMFYRIEEELAKNPQPASVMIRTMDGDLRRQQIPYPEGLDSLHDSTKHKHVVLFTIYQYMVYNAARGNQESDNARKKTTCALEVGWTTEKSTSIENLQLQVMWDEAHRRWIQSTVCSELIDIFKKSAQFPKTVKKIICFGLGTLERTIDRRAACDGQPLCSAMTQHAAAITLAAVFAELLDTNPLPILVQDPGYSLVSKTLLTELGFEVVGGHGSLGFTHVDDDTAVFSCHPDIPVKQIVADIAKPAIMIWNRVAPAAEERTEWTVKVVRGREVRCSPWWSDQDSPRTRMLVEGYNRHDFPRERERFGDLEIYIRND